MDLPPYSGQVVRPGLAGLAVPSEAQELLGALRTLVRILFETPHDESVELRRNGQLGPLRWWHRPRLHVLQEHLHRRVGLEHQLARQQGIGDASERVHVVASGDVGLAENPFPYPVCGRFSPLDSPFLRLDSYGL